jgi:hypothetical protein
VRRACSSSAALAAAAHAIACQDVLDALPSHDDDDNGDDTRSLVKQGGGGLFSTSDVYSLPLPLQQTMAECGDLLAELRCRYASDGDGDGGQYELRRVDRQLSRLWRLYATIRDAVC